MLIWKDSTLTLKRENILAHKLIYAALFTSQHCFTNGDKRAVSKRNRDQLSPLIDLFGPFSIRPRWFALIGVVVVPLYLSVSLWNSIRRTKAILFRMLHAFAFAQSKQFRSHGSHCLYSDRAEPCVMEPDPQHKWKLYRELNMRMNQLIQPQGLSHTPCVPHRNVQELRLCILHPTACVSGTCGVAKLQCMLWHAEVTQIKGRVV